LVNEKLWDESHHIYNDLTKEGDFITELQPGALCKHVHMFWPLIAEIIPADRLANMVVELKNPASFNRASGIPSLSADSKGYNAENGQYWRGAVWPSAQCMVQEGLKATHQDEFLQSVAEKYYAACLKTYGTEKTIKENLAPDKPAGFGAGDFVGWGGVGPVANFIEYILGFEINAPEQTITWRIKQPERHGLENFQFNGFKVDLICDAAAAGVKTRHVIINSAGAFTLKLIVGNQTTEKKIVPGTQSFDLAVIAPIKK
jgi:Glycosyl hydrolase family 63 C-terminal domain